METAKRRPSLSKAKLGSSMACLIGKGKTTDACTAFPAECDETSETLEALEAQLWRETKGVRISKALMVAVMLAAGSVICTAAYLIIKSGQESELTSKFQNYGQEIIESSESNAVDIFQAIASLAFSVTTYSIESNSTFPFVTHPYFAQLGNFASELSGAVLLVFSPFVSEENRSSWNAYSTTHQGWLRTSLVDQELNTTSLGPIYNQIYYTDKDYESPLNTGTAADHSSWLNETEGGPYAPVWQVAPISSEVADYINLNVLRHPWNPIFVRGMNDTRRPVISCTAPFGRAKDHLEHIRVKHGIVPDTTDSFPHSVLFYPVFDVVNPGDNPPVGMIMAAFPWDTFFRHLLHDGAPSVLVVVDDHCGNTFTFQIQGEVVSFMGHSDLHDSRYNQNVLTTDFAKNQSPNFIPCRYELKIYPTEAFVNTYITNDPAVNAAVVATIFLATSLAFIFYDVCVTRRQKKVMATLRETKTNAATEKAALMVQSATRAAQLERDLNDYIAHEVRNPLAAAISAASFVSSAVQDPSPLRDSETIDSVREDVGIIESSLQFINELLRNMLDMHRASSKQLKIDLGPTDILRDVLEPAASMLYQRGAGFELEIDCPEHLVVLTDRLRLTQIVLNLSRNSSKFVSKGFIRLAASLLPNGTVQVVVEDSGPGIPLDKRPNLFRKFQESLDSCNQGTGVGLCLCKNLAELMDGELYLDDTYDSGVPGFPGTRFVVQLNVPPLEADEFDPLLPTAQASISSNTSNLTDSSGDADLEQPPINTECASPSSTDLPEVLNVLFVDDDMILRKLFARTIRKVLPHWKVTEAANGETALRLMEPNPQAFDVIFMDHYMSTSTGKQLLGTETTRMLRAQGVTSAICGLSANDMESAFLESGANAFMLKPFPTKEEQLKSELQRILSTAQSKEH